MGAAFVTAPASERTLDAGAYLLGVIELLLILAPLAYAAWRLRGTLLAGWTGAAARVVEAVLAISGLILLAELLGTFAAFEWWSMALGAVAIALAAHLFASSPLAARGRCAAGSEGLDCGDLARRDRVRSRGRRVDGAHPGEPRRRHGSGRFDVVPHAPRDPVRARGAFRDDRLLRPDLLRLVLPGELRGRARGPAARLRPRHPLAPDQPRLAGRSGSPRPTRSAAPTASAP